MHRHVIPVIAIVAMTSVGFLSVTPRSSVAQEEGTPTQVCSQAQLDDQDSIIAVPASEHEGVVTPFGGDFEGMTLYLAVLTLPPDSCLEYRDRNGAIVLVVQQGAIEYTAHVFEDADVQIKKGNNDGDPADTVDVNPDMAVTVAENEWITQDRDVWFTFSNDGDEDAIVSVAVFALDPWANAPCSGGCKKP